jgi:hypothetical protein
MLFLSIFFRNDARDIAKDIDPAAKKRYWFMPLCTFLLTTKRENFYAFIAEFVSF